MSARIQPGPRVHIHNNGSGKYLFSWKLSAMCRDNEKSSVFFLFECQRTRADVNTAENGINFLSNSIIMIQSIYVQCFVGQSLETKVGN